ncbi:MAG: GNAT family N-acetyltransferase [Candidatus Limnocylindrales bacterium]
MTDGAPGVGAAASRARIRPAVPDDARGIAEIRVASWRATYGGIVPAAILDGMDGGRNETWLAERIADPGASITLVTEGIGERLAGYALAGYALAGPCRDDDGDSLGEIEAIYLDPEVRGRGLGRPLLEAAAVALRAAGFRIHVLWVLTANDPARRFYERAGFSTDGASRMLDFDGTPIQEIRYRRSGSA